MTASDPVSASSNTYTYAAYTGRPLGGYGWTGYGWGGYGWNPLFIGGGYFCDPFSLMLYGDPACFIPGAYMYGYYPMFGYDPFFANFGFAGPFSSSSLLFGAGLLGPNCLLCSSFGFDPFLSDSFALDPYRPTPGNSAGISNGDLSVLLTTTAVPESADATTSPATSYTYANPAATNQPVTLVLTNGKTIQATEYKLTAYGTFRYVTTSGETETIPLAEVDIQATMKANQDKGVDFLVPKARQTAPQDHARQQPTAANPS
jgi:hypothetical protein